METNSSNDFITAFTGKYPSFGVGPGQSNDPDVCPRCGARRSAIRGMLGEPVNSPAHQLGKEHVVNCSDCRRAILSQIEREQKQWSQRH